VKGDGRKALLLTRQLSIINTSKGLNHRVAKSGFAYRPDGGMLEMKDLFHRIAHKTSNAVGSAWAFSLALLIIIAWAASGPIFGFSDTWQLVINTSTTIITFLMVFLIQNTQNRDAKVLHMKLDELIRVTKQARNHLVDLEDCTDEELEQLEKEFQRLRKRDEAKRKKPGKPSKE
jgi:low affinity Fe/Cu permease